MNTTYAILQPGMTLGQTFVASYDGLSGVEIQLAPDIAGDGNIILYLRREPEAQEDLATSQIAVKTIDTANLYRFSFDPIENSRRQYYYLFLEMQGEGRLQVGMAWGGAYLDGAIYQDHLPYNSQMAFSLVYDSDRAVVGALRQIGSWFGLLLFGIFLYVLPGWAILRGLWKEWSEHTWVEKLALSSGLSLAVTPLLLLWTYIVGLQLGAGYAWWPGIISVLALIWLNRHSLTPKGLSIPVRVDLSDIFSKRLPDIVFIFVLFAVIFVRFWSVRNLDLPMWGDSYQHTVITQLMLDNEGLFDAWDPYAPLESLTYHYGFHAGSAIFGWLTGLPATRAVIWVGQIFNVLAVLAVYPYAMRLGGNRWGGISAVLIAGLLFQIPMSYVNWGRYTQLAGQTILPAFALLFIDGMRQEKLGWSKVAILSVYLSGLALTHYRVLIFALAVIPAYFIIEVRSKNFNRCITRLTQLGLVSGVLFLPWFLHVYGARILTIFGAQLTTPASANSSGLDQYNAIGDLTAYLPFWTWLLIPIAIMIGLWLRKREVAYVSVWWLIILLAANPAWLNLPGTGTLSNFAVFIASYLPAAILLGAGIGWFIDRNLIKRKGSNRFLSYAFGLILLVAGLLGGWQRLADVQIDQFALATRPDIQAFEWIRENTPKDAKFVVNYFFSYLDQLIVGSDGGWWLPLLTQRQTNLPPLTYGIEDSSGNEYLESTNNLAKDIQRDGITDIQVLDQLVGNGFEYIYIGQRQGEVNNPGPVVLDAEVLSQDPHFQMVYRHDKVWIFKILP